MPMNTNVSHVKSLVATQKLAQASKGQNFTTAPETTQWKCTCGACNPARKTQCSFCGEPYGPRQPTRE